MRRFSASYLAGDYFVAEVTETGKKKSYLLSPGKNNIVFILIKQPLFLKSKFMKTDLRKIPGVGDKIEEALIQLGYSSVASLRGLTLKRCLKGIAD